MAPRESCIQSGPYPTCATPATVTLAPATTAPELSRTVPVMPPTFVCWAHRSSGLSRLKSKVFQMTRIANLLFGGQVELEYDAGPNQEFHLAAAGLVASQSGIPWAHRKPRPVHEDAEARHKMASSRR